tara:strand:- start:3250 stop:5679 length:2430 start_codon:yes stop_codon:yes gene_type:complete
MTITPEQLEREKEYTKVLQQQADAKERQAKVDKTASDARKNDLENIADLENRIREIKLDSELATTRSDQVEMNKQLYEISQLIYDLQQKSEFAVGEEAAMYEKQIADLQLIGQQLQKNGAIAKKQTESQEKLSRSTNAMFDGLLRKTQIFQDHTTTGVGSLIQMTSEIMAADDPMESFANSFTKYFNALNVATGLFYTIKEQSIGLAQALDRANVAFAEGTGLGNEFQSTIAQAAIENNHLGIEMREAGRATEALLTSTALFSEQSKKLQGDMVKLGAELSKIGVDGNTAAESLNIFQLNMDMSGNEAIKMSKKLAMMGKAMGKTSAQMTKDFQQAFSVLAVHGEESIEVFQGLSAAAKTAGLEVGKLTTLAGKFDTFESAATTTGKLNALLGSQLSATEMLMMKEDERVETLIRQVQAQDVAFKDMDRFQQKAIASAAGITDMNEAQRIFGMNMEQFSDHREKMEKQANVQENFSKAIEATIPIQEKFTIFLREFAIVVEPLLGMMESFFDVLIFLTNEIGETGMQIIFFTSVVTIGYFAFTNFTGAITKGKAALNALKATQEALTTIAKAQNAQTAAGEAIQKTKNVTDSAAGVISGQQAVKETAEMNARNANTASKSAAIGPTVGLGQATGVAGAAATKGAIGFLAVAAGIGLIAVGIAAVIAAYARYIEAQARVEASSARSMEAMSTFGDAMVDTKALDAGLSIMKARLSEIKTLLTEDDAILAHGLENLALAATGVSARKMSGGAAEVATTLKTAVAAAVTSRHEITLKLKDDALFNLIDKEGSRALTSANGEMRKAVLKIIND